MMTLISILVVSGEAEMNNAISHVEPTYGVPFVKICEVNGGNACMTCQVWYVACHVLYICAMFHIFMPCFIFMP